MNRVVNYFKAKRNLTAERPTMLAADALARYYFAKKHCVGKSVLDLGTGFGLGANYLANHGAKEVVGVDYNKEVIREASRLKHKNVSFKALDVLEIDSLQRKFDVVLAFEIIEHLPVSHVGEFVAAMAGCLSPGGILLLTTPNKKNSRSFLGRPYNPYHVKEYTPKELKIIFSKYFSEVRIEGLRCKNDFYKRGQAKLESTLVYKISYFIGHFKFVRELLALVPRNLKRGVTGEETLPELSERDYELSGTKGSPGLFVAAKNIVYKNNSPSVSIIIANYNGERFLESCLRSVLKTDYPNFEVIVADDYSTDKSRVIIGEFQKKDKRVRLVKNPENVGAAGTRNRAFAYAKNEIVVFLDNDMEVKKSWLSELVKPLLLDLTIGATQALILDMRDRRLVQQAGAILMRQTGWSIPFHQWINYAKIKPKLEERPIAGVSGALAVKREVFKQLRGFDTKEAVYTEDLDFSWRMWVGGNKVVICPKAVVYHYSKRVEERANMGANYYKIYFHLAKNSFRSILKNYELANSIRYAFTSALVNITRALLVALRRRDLTALKGTVDSFIWNIQNFADTRRARKSIQKSRFFTDKYIMEKVFSKRSLVEIYNEDFSQTKLLW